MLDIDCGNCQDHNHITDIPSPIYPLSREDLKKSVEQLSKIIQTVLIDTMPG